MFTRRRRIPNLAEAQRRLRGFFLDSHIEDTHELALAQGCSPISDEVADREEEESDKRTDKIAHLVPLMYAFAHSMAGGAIDSQRDTIEASVKLPPELWKQTERMMEGIALAVTQGTISQLVDMGYLQIPKRITKGARK